MTLAVLALLLPWAWAWIIVAPACSAAEPAGPATAPADDAVAADLKTIADPDAADEVVDDAAVRLRESLEGPLPPITLAALLRHAEHPDAKLRVRAMHLLGLLGPRAEVAIPDLVRIVREAKPDRRIDAHLAILALGRIGRRADVAVPVISPALNSPDADVRSLAAFALGQFGRDAAPAIPLLIRQVDDVDPGARLGAISALGRIGPQAREAAPTLLALLDLPRVATDRFEPARREAAIEALGRMQAEAAIPRLTTLLKQGPPAEWSAAAFALGRIGPPAKSAVADLEQPVEAPELVPPVAFALVRLGRPEEGFARLKRSALDDASGMDVFDTLVELGPPAVPVLSDVIRSDSKNGRWAIQAVEKLGPGGKAAVPALLDVVKAGRGKGSQRFKFDEALVALRKLGPDAREAAPTLRELIATTKSEEVRDAAAAALRKVESATPASRPTR
jgi:HEAT repeat protein